MATDVSTQVSALGALRLGTSHFGVPGSKPRALLATLLVNANTHVSVDQLVDDLWERAPASAVNLLRQYVSRLRQFIPACTAEAIKLETCHIGYLLYVPPGVFDVVHFERLADAGRQTLADGDFERAQKLLRTSLDLWHGQRSYADVPESFSIEVERRRLEERRLEAQTLYIESALRTGRAEEVVGELRKLISGHPLNERLQGQLMRALYSTGRKAEALMTFRAARTLIVNELGLEPGEDLRLIESAILRSDKEFIAAP